jgi:signal transduction histidine kinase/ActR/RegA family two-component response regulator
MKIAKAIAMKRPSSISVNMIGLNVLFSLFYWVMESVRDVIIFNKGNILERVFKPDPMSFWMRMMVIFIFILFSVYSGSLRQKMENRRGRVSSGADRYGIIWAGLACASLYWILEAFRDVFVYNRGNFFHRLVMPDAMGFWMRILVVFILVLFSIYAQSLVNQRRKIEADLMKSHEDLENQVKERTAELVEANALLTRQVTVREKAEAELRRVNRALQTLSACNEIMFRTNEETNLLRQICDTLSEMGGYPLVWVGYLVQNGKTEVRPVTQCGTRSRDARLAALATEDFQDEKNPIGQAVRTGNASMVKYLANTGRTEKPWAVEAVEAGFNSLLSLPLKHDNAVFGALSLYSTDPEAFDMQELELLGKLADNLAFGISVLRTRSQRDQAEDEKEKMYAQLMQSHKMEAIGILAGGVAHDFNNLLTAIQVSADLGMLEVGESSSLYKTLKEIHQVSAHAADLARQLLLFSRKHPMEYAPLNLNGTVQNLYKMLKRLIGENVSVETRFEPGIWIIQADRGTMEQVVMNLAVNARDAMPKGGKLVLETKNVILDESVIAHMPDSRPGHFVCFSVSDTGKGMAKDVLQRIFEPFFSTKGIGKGTGLGLSVVYGIVKQHGGWIRVQSRPGKGTAFDVYLPATMDGSVRESTETICAGVGAHYGKGERILMIEDDEKVRQFAEKGLVQSGYAVVQAFTAFEAKERFIRENGDVDLVFVDVVLPDQSGVDLVDELMRLKPDLKVLFTSGYTDHKSQWFDIRERGFNYLQKPYGLAELLRTVRSSIDAFPKTAPQNQDVQHSV